jgi:hypothetical protein
VKLEQTSKRLPETRGKNTFFLIVVFFYVSRNAGLRRAASLKKANEQGTVHCRDIRRRF